MLIAQVTDTHLRAPGERGFHGRVDTAARLAQAVDYLNALAPAPDLVVLTGDLVDNGRPAEYDHLAAVLRPLKAPFLLIPGNHDLRDPLRAAFPDIARRAPGGFVHYAVDELPVRIVALDSTEEGRVGGILCAERLAWIEATLAASKKPTVMLMHHPPYDYGVLPNEKMSCAKGADALGAIVAKHWQVEAILSGHLHRATTVRWHGTVASTVPATAPMFEMRLGGQEPSGWLDTPPAVGLHLWRPGQGLVSHVATVAEPSALVRFPA
ncbi:MAG: phosphodiesterase [Alphaproteobacteria bacterium]|nr:phosphodiesterase [Alphaproteobacteria bacterium]